MTKQPWMKFYPADWRADPALRSCSMAARGMWMEMLAIMHEATTRGELTINGEPVSVRQMAALAGCSQEEAEKCMTELERAGVFSRRKNRVIYSRRMEKDENSARKNRENGKLGGNPSLSKRSRKTGSDNPPDKAQKPEARSQKEYSDASASDATASSRKPDERDLLWNEDGPRLAKYASRSLTTTKSLIGRLLKLSGDDPTAVRSKIQFVIEDRIGEPFSWLIAAFTSSEPDNSEDAQLARLQALRAQRERADAHLH